MALGCAQCGPLGTRRQNHTRVRGVCGAQEGFRALAVPDLLPRVQITAANRRFHFSLMAEWRFSRGVQEQTEAFLGGFNEVVPLQWLQYFDEKELEVRPSPRAAGGGGCRPRALSPLHASSGPRSPGPRRRCGARSRVGECSPVAHSKNSLKAVSCPRYQILKSGWSSLWSSLNLDLLQVYQELFFLWR